MVDKPSHAAPLRSRAPDSAADLGLYAAPLALGAPVMLAAIDAGPAQAAASSSREAESASVETTGANAPAPALGWWSDDAGAGAGVTASIGPAGSTTPSVDARSKVEADNDAQEGKTVILHAGASAPPSHQPVSNLEPVERVEAGVPASASIDPVVPPASAAASFDHDGLSALNAIGALTNSVASGSGDAVQAVTKLAQDGLSLATGTVQAATGLLGETVDGLSDLLSGLGPVGGSDPIGGIATLVGLVGAADLFDLRAIDAPADTVLLAASETADLLGAPLDLVEAAPTDVLLGIADPQDGPLGLLAHLTDDAI